MKKTDILEKFLSVFTLLLYTMYNIGQSKKLAADIGGQFTFDIFSVFNLEFCKTKKLPLGYNCEIVLKVLTLF